MELIKLKQYDDKLKEEYWKAIVQECNQATMTGEIEKKEWLKERNISRATFYKWQKLFRNEIATNLLIENAQEKAKNGSFVANTTKEVEFIELRPTTAVQKTSSSSAVLKFNHASIEINDDISEDLLSKIIKVISHAE